jgi:hypothetical protein
MTEIIAITSHGGMKPGKSYLVGEKLAEQLIKLKRAKRPGEPDPVEVLPTPQPRRGRKRKA